MLGMWILVSGLVAVSASTRPASRPATLLVAPTTAPAKSAATTSAATEPGATQMSGDPAVDRILERLERRGDEVHSLTSELQADFLDVVVDDKQSRLGSIWFRRDKPNPKFKVVYRKSIFGDVETDDKHEYLFDGEYLIEKHYRSTNWQKRQIVAKGEKIEPFRIGKGPFPLPFGQKKAEILEHFVVTRIRRSAKDPRRTDHLKLVPCEDSSMAEQYAELHFYIDKKLQLPVRVVAHQFRPGSKDVDEIVTVTFTDLKINPGVSDDVLMIPKPKGKDWHCTEERLPDTAAPPTKR